VPVCLKRTSWTAWRGPAVQQWGVQAQAQQGRPMMSCLSTLRQPSTGRQQWASQVVECWTWTARQSAAVAVWDDGRCRVPLLLLWTPSGPHTPPAAAAAGCSTVNWVRTGPQDKMDSTKQQREVYLC
jgi:hypothetical protein